MYFSKASLFLLPSLLYLGLAKPVPDFSSNLLSLVAPTLGYHVAKPVSSPASTQDLSTGGTTEEQTEQPSEHCRAPSTGATAFQRFTKSHLSVCTQPETDTTVADHTPLSFTAFGTRLRRPYASRPP